MSNLNDELIYPDGYVQKSVTLRRITVLAFRSRFTKEEKVRIDLASIDNPGGTSEERQLAAGIRVSLADVIAATYIDLDRQDTRQDVQTMELAGLIGPGRALQIVDAEVQDFERYVEKA